MALLDGLVQQAEQDPRELLEKEVHRVSLVSQDGLVLLEERELQDRLVKGVHKASQDLLVLLEGQVSQELLDYRDQRVELVELVPLVNEV